VTQAVDFYGFLPPFRSHLGDEKHRNNRSFRDQKRDRENERLGRYAYLATEIKNHFLEV